MNTVSNYPIPTPPDDRFTPELVEAAADLIQFYGYPFIGGPDLERLRVALLHFIYADPEGARGRLCAHADQNGEGMHWLAPGERCTR